MDLSRYGPGVSPLAAALANYQPTQGQGGGSPGGNISSGSPGAPMAGAGPSAPMAPYAVAPAIGTSPMAAPQAVPTSAPAGLAPGPGVAPLTGTAAGANLIPVASLQPQQPSVFGFGGLGTPVGGGY
jgi:hypothetical protein